MVDYTLLGRVMVEKARGEGWVEHDIVEMYRCDKCVCVIEADQREEHTKWHAFLEGN